jgi:hypothetical protein
VAITVFAGEILASLGDRVRRSIATVYFHGVNKGGHVAARERPELFAEEIRASFRFASDSMGPPLMARRTRRNSRASIRVEFSGASVMTCRKKRRKLLGRL